MLKPPLSNKSRSSSPRQPSAWRLKEGEVFLLWEDIKKKGLEVIDGQGQEPKGKRDE